MIEPWFTRDTSEVDYDPGCGKKFQTGPLDDHKTLVCGGATSEYGVALCEYCRRIADRIYANKQFKLQEEKFPMPI